MGLPTLHSYAQVSVTLKGIMQDCIWLTWCYLKIEISVVLGGTFALHFILVPTIPFSFHLYSLFIYATCLVPLLMWKHPANGSWLYYCNIITEPTGAHSCGTLEHGPTMSIGSKWYLFTVFQPWGVGTTSAWNPVLPRDPALPLLPKGWEPKASKPEVLPYLNLSQLHKQFFSPSGRYKSLCPHTAAFSFRIWAIFSSASM